MTEGRREPPPTGTAPHDADEWSAVADVALLEIIGRDEFLGYAPRIRKVNTLTRLLTRLSGGDPDEIQKYPDERPRYIGLGWTMLMTSAFAMVGMAVLLTQISDIPLLLRLLAAAGWGVFVLGIDYVVVGFVDAPRILADALSLPGPRSRGIRWPTVIRTVIRLVFAVIVGIAVGESLVIGAFSSTADAYMDTRAATETKARLCLVETTLSNYRPEVVPGPYCRQQLEVGVRGDPQTTTSLPVTTVAPPTGTEAQIRADHERLAILDQQIKFQSDRAQCELYPQVFTPDQIAALACSNRSGNGSAHQAALDQLSNLQSEKDAVVSRLDTLARTTADSATIISRMQADSARAKAQIELDRRDSKEAIDAAAQKTTLEGDLQRILAPGPAKRYSLSERFEATQKAVNPWIRWGLYMLFILADMAPVLMKITMGPSARQVDRVLDGHAARLSKLVEAANQEDAYVRARRAYADVRQQGGSAESKTDTPTDETAQAF